ncbi:MAG: DUF4132 domain-containing protein [Candidatus Saccharibacteria bacterium]|nr:DUF4132 domain-containing protein [Moraxellaceae bacterium]
MDEQERQEKGNVYLMQRAEQFQPLIQAAKTLATELQQPLIAYFIETQSAPIDNYAQYKTSEALIHFSNVDNVGIYINLLIESLSYFNDKTYHNRALGCLYPLLWGLTKKQTLFNVLERSDVLPFEIADPLKDYLLKIYAEPRLRESKYPKIEEAQRFFAEVTPPNFKQATYFLTQEFIALNKKQGKVYATGSMRDTLEALLSVLYKRKEMQNNVLLKEFFQNFDSNAFIYNHKLIANLLSTLEKLKANNILDPTLLPLIKIHLVDDQHYLTGENGVNPAALKDRIQTLLYSNPEVLELPFDESVLIQNMFGSSLITASWPPNILADIESLDHAEKVAWYALWNFAATAKSSAPSVGWLKKAENVVEPVRSQFAVRVVQWLELIIQKSPTKSLPFSGKNATAIRGLLWMCPLSQSDQVAQAVSNMVQFCYTKLYGIGPRSSVVANAGLYALGDLGNVGVVQLSKLRKKVKYSVGANLIEKMLREAALRQGVTTDDLEEMVVPELDMDQDGKQIFSFGEYQATLSLDGTKHLTVVWQDKNGKILKAPPAAVKKDHADDFKEFKQITAEVETIISGQSTRLEKNILKDRQWIFNTWQERFIQHAILGWLGRRVIWQFDDQGVIQHGMWLNKQLVNCQGEALQSISDNAQVKIWHPIFSDMHEVQAWRELIRAHQIVQPFKQAFREVYLLTPAEEQTESYSNRFAGHYLKQFQLVALCRERGWSYQLQGGWDGANDPTFGLPHWNIRVRLELKLEEEFPLTPSGIYQYVLTDKVFFYHSAESHKVIPVRDIPALVFSEVMRDLDLFVGVCSIGLDPNLDMTNPQIQRYFNDFNTSELTATAQVRKSVLDNIISKLEIAPLCRFEGKYLIVKGTLRSYKIHLGSGNILMEPNDQYLCIVQDGKKGDTVTDGLYLPFEGDHLLSIILSKALLLAADNKIKDQSILAQIKGR